MTTTIIMIFFELLLWLVLIPFGMGIFPVNLFKREKRSVLLIYMCGLVFMFAVFQIAGTAFIFKFRSFSEFSKVFTIIACVISFSGIIYTLIDMGKNGIDSYFYKPSFKSLSKKDIFTYVAFIALVLLQMFASFVLASPDDDDSVYVALANIANNLDKMFIISPETGCSERIDFRHAISSFPMFYAFLAQKCDLHVAIIAHKILPPFLIFVSYCLYYQIGMLLFNKDSSKNSVFMMLIAALQVFGAYSIYSKEVFFLTRTWQGKSVLANAVVPGAFFVLLLIAKQEKDKKYIINMERIGYYVLLTLVNIVGIFASGLGMLILPIYEAIVLFAITIKKKSIGYLIMGIFTVMPCVVYWVLYIYYSIILNY